MGKREKRWREEEGAATEVEVELTRVSLEMGSAA